MSLIVETNTYEAVGIDTYYAIPTDVTQTIGLTITLDGVSMVLTTDYTVDYLKGEVTFLVAPTGLLKITFSKQYGDYTDNYYTQSEKDKLNLIEDNATLEIYSEGVYSPILSGVTYTENSAIGNYKVINGICFCSIQLDVSSFDNLNTAEISLTLPFDPITDSLIQGNISVDKSSLFIFLANNSFNFTTLNNTVLIKNSDNTNYTYDINCNTLGLVVANFQFFTDI